MLYVSLDDRLAKSGPLAQVAWHNALKRATNLSITGAWMFHGTNLTRARSIVTEGFRCPWGIVPTEKNHVYWGPLKMAISFADKGSFCDRPALLCAPLTAVLLSGEPLPMTAEDRQCMDGEPELPDWQASYAESGAFRVRAGARVEGLRLLGNVLKRIAA